MERTQFFYLFAAIQLLVLAWIALDARARGKPAWLIVLLVAVLPWPLGIFTWFYVRPEKRGDGLRHRS